MEEMLQEKTNYSINKKKEIERTKKEKGVFLKKISELSADPICIFIFLENVLLSDIK